MIILRTLILKLIIVIILSIIRTQCITFSSNTASEIPANEFTPTDIELQSEEYFWQSFSAGFSIIFISGIGDKTFFLCMIFSATNTVHKSILICCGIMLILNFTNLVVGVAMPFIMYKDAIDWIAIGLFTIFGVKMILEGIMTESQVIEKDLEEIKHSVRLSHQTHDRMTCSAKISENNLEEGNNLKENLIPKDKPDWSLETFDSTWAFAFALVIGECGDKSQIATILIGALHNFPGVLLGTSLATIALVILSIFFGNLLSKKLTNREINIGGGILFFSFAVVYFSQKMQII